VSLFSVSLVSPIYNATTWCDESSSWLKSIKSVR